MSPKSSIFNSLITAALVLFAVFITLYSIQSPTKADVSRLSDNATEAQIELAKHLQSTNSTMYGSYKCGHCNTQKAMFASAFKYINYVECNNKGPKANPSLCFAKGIKRYPTWESNGKFYQGSFSLKQLSELSGFNPAESKK